MCEASLLYFASREAEGHFFAERGPQPLGQRCDGRGALGRHYSEDAAQKERLESVLNLKTLLRAARGPRAARYAASATARGVAMRRMSLRRRPDEQISS